MLQNTKAILSIRHLKYIVLGKPKNNNNNNEKLSIDLNKKKKKINIFSLSFM